MKPFDQVIKRPIITEKALLAKETLGRYSFEVAHDATKPAIREAIEAPLPSALKRGCYEVLRIQQLLFSQRLVLSFHCSSTQHQWLYSPSKWF